MSKNANNSLSDWLSEKLEKDVGAYEVLIPIHGLLAMVDIEFPEMRITHFGIDKCRKYFDLDRKPEELHDKIKRPFHGKAVAIVEVLGEPKHAVKLAHSKVKNAVCLLNVYSFMLMGLYYKQSTIYPSQEGGVETIEWATRRNDSFSESGSLLYPGSPPFQFTDEHREIITKSFGFQRAARILLKPENEFQQKIANAIIQIGKGGWENDLSSKLFFVITAIESLFLLGGDEKIKETIADRLAFCIRENYNEKVRIITNFNKVYDARSKLFHYLASVEETEEIKKFFDVAFQVIVQLVGEADNYSTKEDYISYLRRLALGGEPK